MVCPTVRPSVRKQRIALLGNLGMLEFSEIFLYVVWYLVESEATTLYSILECQYVYFRHNDFRLLVNIKGP